MHCFSITLHKKPDILEAIGTADFDRLSWKFITKNIVPYNCWFDCNNFVINKINIGRKTTFWVWFMSEETGKIVLSDVM